MNESDHCHEQAIERALRTLEPDALGTAQGPRTLSDDEATIAALTREYTETAALLAFSDEPAVPNPAIREQLMSTLAGQAPKVHAEAERFRPQPVVRNSRSSVQRSSFWRPALAAAAAFCLVGLAYFAGQGSERQANPQSVVAASPVVDQAVAVEALAARVAQLENNLHMVTTIAREVYPVRHAAVTGPATATGRGMAKGPMLNGKVFVCGRHQQWYLNVEGLEPAPSDQAYQLWFMTNDGPVAAGILDVVPQQAAELGARAMPTGTRGFIVTLEPIAGSLGPQRNAVTAPTSKPILVADRAIRI